jgi:hypothetical protein
MANRVDAEPSVEGPAVQWYPRQRSRVAGDDRLLFFAFRHPVAALTVETGTAQFQLYTVPSQVW